ncbi:MAG: hypothetical protein AB7U82_29585, partial [Blastocatellales bacterium]
MFVDRWVVAQLCSQWLRKGEIEKAIEDFFFAISFDPQLDQAYYNPGIPGQATRESSSEPAFSGLERSVVILSLTLPKDIPASALRP